MSVAVRTTVARKGRPTADDARQKLATVLAVARDQFAQLGYRAVTIRGVAQEADVSTRTLYNWYADKLSLFTACLDFGAEAFPKPDPVSAKSIDDVLKHFAAEVVRVLSVDSSVRLGMLVYREGAEFPELLRAAESNQDRHLVQPLAAYLRKIGIESAGRDDRAKLFINMALSEWQRRIAFRRQLPRDDEIDEHAALVVETFLYGSKAK